MTYDLLIKEGRIIDGSGRPAFHGDVAVAHGRIVELGRLNGAARRVIEADGRVVAPGFVDNHCHYDAQVLWDPLCSFSCFHGATTVIIGNCSLALAPVRAPEREKLAGMLSYVEAIPMDVLQAGVPWTWETFPQYMNVIGQRLGVNVGTLVGHSAARLYAMGADCSERPATDTELEVMRGVVREALEAGALGLSLTRNMNHFDVAGKRIPAACAPESELFALADVLRESGTGVIQCGGGTNPELKDRLLSRLAQACGRPIMYNTLLEQARLPGQWRQHLAHVEEIARQGIRAVPLCNPGSIVSRFTMKNCQVFRGMPTWLPLLQASDAEKLRAYRDPEVRAKLRAEVEAPLGPDSTFSKRWDLMVVEEPQLPKNRELKGQNVAEIATAQGKDPLDAFLDLAVEEALETVFSLGEINMDTEAVAQILGSPYAVVGLSDGGAHVQFHSNVSNPTRLLGYWVREKGIMSLELAVRRLTFDSASAFGIYDRGLLQPGMAADLVVFDADTVRPAAEDVVHDFPNNGWRIRELAEGIHYTVVNGEVLLEKGAHTGSYPGQVLHNARYQAAQRGSA
ncbi:MAG TPA: amidohydrolase family protein [Methylomirabilota bacterium]|jgi:N-acyl-D-aspartate/D-glutamate deacylase|nr:amidohydrolase family protein [Methylomirabilota bacterium]